MFAVLHVADFALQAILRQARGLSAQPVALLDAGRRNAFVIACTAPARQAGVEAGQSAPQAMARCARLIVRSPEPAAEQEALAGLLAAAFSLSPYVETTAEGVCTVQISGVPAERRKPALHQALARLERFGFDATAGVGETPLLALYAARRATPLLIVPQGRDFLAPLPLAVAEPPAGLAAILAEWGITTLGGYTALSKAEVTHRLGPAGLALWERAAGETSRPLRVVAPAGEFSAALECEYELETLEPLLFILRRFVDRLALELANAGMAAGELSLHLGLSDETVHTHDIRLPEPSGDADILFRTLQTYLKDLRTSASLVGVRLRITPVRPLTRQHGLFDRALRDPHGFAETLARVAALVGSDRVGTPELLDAHRPDSLRLVPPPAVLPPWVEKFSHPTLGLALRRHRPPRPATVELNGTQPAYIWTDQLHGAVAAVRGPWQASGDWWQADRTWQQEEWDVGLLPAGLYRLARTPDGWFLEGEYD